MKLTIETTDDTFELDVIERSKEVPVVVDFWATWCAPCRMLAPMLETLASEFAGKFVLVKANTEEMPKAARQFRIQSIPAVYGFRDGELRDYYLGVLPEDQLRSWLIRLLPTEAEHRVAEATKIAQIDPQTAEHKYREALQLDPDLAKAKIGLAALLLPQGRLDECRELLKELERRGFLELAAQRISTDLELHRKAREVGSVDECRAASEAAPDKPDLKLNLAEALAAAIVADLQVPVFAVKREDNETYYRHIHSVLDGCPQITMDDGADLVSTLHEQRLDLLENVIGGTEETTTGLARLRAMAVDNILRYPIIAVNDAMTKHLFDNRYGTGQSTIDGILRATNILLAGMSTSSRRSQSCSRCVSRRSDAARFLQRCCSWEHFDGNSSRWSTSAACEACATAVGIRRTGLMRTQRHLDFADRAHRKGEDS